MGDNQGEERRRTIRKVRCLKCRWLGDYNSLHTHKCTCPISYMGLSYLYKDVKMKTVKNPSMSLGLMFKSRDSESICFEWDEPVELPIHSLFVFHPFRARWYDKDGELIKEEIIKPFKTGIKPDKPFVKIEEEFV